MSDTTIPAPAPKSPELMFACIERRHGVTFCNRMISEKEFTFSSSAARHIVSHYDPRTQRRSASLRLSGCIACIDVAKEILEKEDVSRLA